MGAGRLGMSDEEFKRKMDRHLRETDERVRDEVLREQFPHWWQWRQRAQLRRTMEHMDKGGKWSDL